MSMGCAMSGGAPTVASAGPWLPPDTTHDTPYLFTTILMISPTRLTKYYYKDFTQHHTVHATV